MNNKKIGSEFEKELAEKLSEIGYWVTFITPKQNVGSQPCDLIAIKDNNPVLIDCKTCSTHLFPIKRIEENQWQAYKKFKKCGNNDFVLAIRYKEKIYIIPLDIIDENRKSIDLDTLSYVWEVKTNENYSIEKSKGTRVR